MTKPVPTLDEFVDLYKKHKSVRVIHNATGQKYGRNGLETLRKEAFDKKLIEEPTCYQKKTDLKPEDIPDLYEKYGSLKAIHREMKIPWRRVTRAYRQALDAKIINRIEPGVKPRGERKNIRAPVGYVKPLETKTLPLPEKGKVARYLFSAAQNDTKLFEAFWTNLNALAEHYGAEIHIARFTYDKSALGARGEKIQDSTTTRVPGSQPGMVWDSRLVKHFSDERLQVAPGLVWCGEMNILPTAVRPLSGMDTYTGRQSGIFPHAKIAMESVASNKHEPTKFNYTTGAITQRNYIHKKAGLKGDSHHNYAALLVEVDDEGNWFARQVTADEQGTIHDMDVRVRHGKLTTGNRVQAIYWGDPHVLESHPVATNLAFAEGMMKDHLRPKEDFMGDVITFRPRSHHDIKDPHLMYLRHVQGVESVEDEVLLTGAFLNWAKRDYCQTRLVYGNHERHLGRWLKEQDGRQDPVNAPFWLRAQAKTYEEIAKTGKEPNYLKVALELLDPSYTEGIDFIAEDESRIVCRDKDDGIECGMHGDRGANGARGTAINLAKSGRRICIGDKHSAQILDTVWVAGTFCRPDVGWNKGLSSWSWSHIVIYPNGTRAIVTFWNGKYMADRGLPKSRLEKLNQEKPRV